MEGIHKRTWHIRAGIGADIHYRSTAQLLFNAVGYGGSVPYYSYSYSYLTRKWRIVEQLKYTHTLHYLAPLPSLNFNCTTL